MGVCVGGLCYVWLCVCKFVMCGCVYVWVLYRVGVCMCEVLMCGCVHVWFL